MYTRESFIEKLGVPELPTAFGLHFEQTMADYEKNGVPFLSDAFLDALQSEYQVFDEKWEFVKKSAKRIRENDFLARYSLLLNHMQRDRGAERVRLEPEPRSEVVEEQVDLEMAAFFACLAFAPDVAAHYRQRGVPHKIIHDTLDDAYQGAIRVCNGCFGRDGFEVKRLFTWLAIYTEYRMLFIGRLNFEIKHAFCTSAVLFQNRAGEYKVLIRDREIDANGQLAQNPGAGEPAFMTSLTETDEAFIGYEADTENALVLPTPVTLPKTEWEVVAQAETPTIGIHIPELGAFTPEAVRTSCRQAVEVFSRCFPEFKPRAFTCFSWLLDPQLRNFLREGSNIVAFQNRFLLFPVKSDGQAPFMFLFRRPVERLEDLAEDTSLQRKVKAHYLDGKYIYTPGGVFTVESLLKEN